MTLASPRRDDDQRASLPPALSAASGWRLTGWATLGVLAIQLGILAIAGTGEEGVRMAVRASARTSLLLFVASFVASSAYHLWPGTFTRWLLRNRRYLGVSFAASHAIHLAAILALVLVFDAEVAALTVVVGGFGYVLIAAMAATSFDRTARLLGAARWKRLHGFGARYVWFVFFVTLIPDGRFTLIRAVAFTAVVAAAAVRTAAALKARRSRPLTAAIDGALGPK